MTKKAAQFFTDPEKELIRSTTADVESRTSGEIVVMVVDKSDDYREGEIIGRIVLGALVSMIVTAFYYHASMWFFIPLAFFAYFPLKIIVRRSEHMRMTFVGPGRREAAVRQRALRAFHEKGLTNTRDRTGVLFFISLLEHKVWVLADKGIHEKVGQETLNKFAKGVSKGIAEDRSCESLCVAMREVGEVLASHFPRKDDDTDELPDGVMSA